ncbi:MAG: hypothetical protein ACE5HB_09810 [Terriglobia bacterium]
MSLLLTHEVKRRLRRVILQLVYENQESQRHRLDDITLHSALDRLHHDVSRNGVRTVLQDLRERGFLRFVSEKNVDTGKVALRKIEITPGGRDIVEGTKQDPAVEPE